MNQPLWEKIVVINELLNPLREVNKSATLIAIDWVELRSKLRKQLEGLRTAITEQNSERDAYFVLFPLIAHCDELVKKKLLDINQLDWPPLQQELYQIADAGDLFYELLDNVLNKPETLPLVYEVYYFCLQDGFCGRYAGNPERINDYQQSLRKHIRLPPLEVIEPRPPVLKRREFFRLHNYIYYTITGVILLLVYVFLTVLAESWNPMN